MKRFMILVWLLLFLAVPSQVFGAAAMIHAGGLIGGSSDDLDAVECEDIIGDDTDRAIATGDRAMVVTTSGTYIYRYDATGTDSEDSPDIIVPDDRATDCSGNGQWNLQALTTAINPSDISLNEGLIIVGDSNNEGEATGEIPNLTIEVMPSTDNAWSGFSYTANAGETIAQWEVVYFDYTDNEWKPADADAAGEWPAWGLATATCTDGNSCVVAKDGCFQATTLFQGVWSDGEQLYLSENADDTDCSDDDCYGLTDTPTTTTGECVQPIGHVIDTGTYAYICIDVNHISGWATVP